jgi:hypothetical protein
MYDAHLDELAQELRYRRQDVAYSEAGTYKPGDQLRLVRIRPKYMTGHVVTFQGYRGSKLVVSCPPVGRFSGQEVLVSPTCVERV